MSARCMPGIFPRDRMEIGTAVVRGEAFSRGLQQEADLEGLYSEQIEEGMIDWEGFVVFQNR